jgi:hypothetical protein
VAPTMNILNDYNSDQSDNQQEQLVDPSDNQQEQLVDQLDYQQEQLVDPSDNQQEQLVDQSDNKQEQLVIEIKELDELDELEQDISWNQYINVNSSLEEEEIPGEIDEFQLQSLRKLAILRSKGLKFNDQLMATRAFKNPCIMEKMLDYHNIDPHGSFIVTDHSFKDAYNNLYKSNDANQIKQDSKDRTIHFVKSSKKYDKRRRI